MLAEILTIIAPVFAVASLGYLWARSGKVFETGMVTQLVVMITTPCLVVESFLRSSLSLATFSTMTLAALSVFVALGTLGALLLLLLGWRHRVYLPSLVFGNAGNMGLPLCLFAFGDGGLALAITIFALSAVLNFTLGMSVAAGGIDPRQLARMPVLYALALSVFFMATGLTLPDWLRETVRLLAGATIPLMLLSLGVALARLTVASLGKALLLSCFRIGGGMTLAFLAAWLFGLHGVERGVLVLQFSMPAAVFNYLFAERYSGAGPEVAGVVLCSTLLSVVTTPLLLWYLLGA